MKKICMLISLIMISLFMISVKSYGACMVYVSGANLGIRLQTELEVLGTYGVDSGKEIVTPWRNKIAEHDIIRTVNSKAINSALELINAVEGSGGRSLELGLIRNNQEIVQTIIPAKNNEGKYSVGLFVKDFEMGVGTLSFVEPKTLSYASLGHKMIDKDITGGSVYQASVREIVMPREHIAGNKKAELVGESIGTVEKNLINGVYGRLNNDSIIKNASLMPLSKAKDASVGEAKILTSVSKMKVESYDIEIIETKSQTNDEIKGLKFKVTDSNLLDKAGGIVQGMSGSPIIQNGSLIGVVTHVMLSDSTLGYGCYAEYMYNTMGFTLDE